MFEFIQAVGNTYYIDSPSKIGVVKLSEGEVCLIDAGNSKETGKKVKKVLDAEGLKVNSILVTHSHADHIGGCKYISSQYNCPIFAKEAECDFTRHTILEPTLLYGANPPKELRHKFLLAEESNAGYLTEKDLPEGFSIIDLPGHFLNMVGFRTPDNAVFVADSLSSKEILDKYGVTYIYDVKKHLETLELLKTIDATVFIPSHAPVTNNIAPLADYNIGKVQEVCGNITDICKTPKTTEDIIASIFDKYSLVMTFEQYALVGSSVRSYLTYLAETGRILSFFSENKLFFERI